MPQPLLKPASDLRKLGPMTLVGQYDSPYTRRVAISLCMAGPKFAATIFSD